MSEKKEFDFGNDAVARSYDEYLLPTLFIPWAQRLIEENGPWENKNVVDLASGTGVIPSLLAPLIQPSGRITAVDINPQMLAVAKQRCSEWSQSIDFIESSAESIELDDNSIDTVLCQQGFQFFPDCDATARRLHKVLKDGGQVIASTWRPVSESRFFEIVCEALAEIDQHELSDMMRVPFDFMSEEDLVNPFVRAGFSEAEVKVQEMDLMIESGVDGAISMIYATPIAPKLSEFDQEMESKFKDIVREKIKVLSPDNYNMGTMATNILVAVK